MIARSVRVVGRVQGVGFRWSTASQADSLGVRGWVQNLVDGSVESHVEGSQDQVEAMLVWLESGPPAARVDEVRSEPTDPVGMDHFEVRHG